MGNFESNESVFNMAMAYLQRIDKLLYKAQESAQIQDIDSWLNYLYCIRRELSVKLIDEEEVELKNMLVNIKKIIQDPRKKITCRSEILGKLDEIDIYMRKKLQQRGMLLPNRSDPRFAILER